MHFWINNHLWCVVDVPANHPKLRDGFRYVLGCCYTHDKEIYVNRELPQWKYERVVAHEITHAFIYEYGIVLPKEQEEMIANLFAEHGREMIAIVDNILQQILEVA